jgi:2-keto-4-pentenoate hydratase/2-oxohepta-3-ene-1,7-dioic acid hydratase in catechol pathway
MRIVRYLSTDGPRVGALRDGKLQDAGLDLIDPQPAGDAVPLDGTRLLAPVAPGAKIVCVGLNYADHARESGAEPPPAPLLFAKLPNALVGPDEDACLPPLSEQLDYEAELAVVIGRRARDVSPEDALEHVFAYTCLNDISARDLQFGDGQWTRGKSLDGSCPVGPWLVTADEIADPHALGIRCRVNGNLLQDSTTAELIFKIPEIVAHTSRAMTLEPGDVIATGTPAGVGFARTPPVYLQDGDEVEVEVDGIGTLRNRIRLRTAA